MQACDILAFENDGVLATGHDDDMVPAPAMRLSETLLADDASDLEMLALLVLDRNLRCRQAQAPKTRIDVPIPCGTPAVGQHVRELLGEAAFVELGPHLSLALIGQPAVFDLRSTLGSADASCRVICTPQFDADGAVDSLQLLIFDRSALRRRRQVAVLREQQFEEAQRLGNLGHWQRDLQANTLESSEGCYRILGLQRGLPLPFDDYVAMIHPEDRERAKRTREQALTEKRGYDYDYRLIRPSGEVRWVEGVTKPVHNDDGDVIGFFGVIHDVTDRRDVESTLKLRERQLDAAQRLGRICHWQWDVATGKFEASDELYRMYGLDPGTPLTLQRVTDPIHPDDRERARDNRELARREKRGYDFAFRLRRGDGEVRWLEGRTEPMFDDSGEVNGYFGVTQDVTELRQAERTNARYLNAIEQLQEGIALYDEDDRLVVCNAAYRRVPEHGSVALEPGISFVEVMRRRREAAFGPEDPKMLEPYFADRMERRRNPSGPMVFRFGETWQQVRDERLADGSTIMVVADITHQRKYEAQLRQAQHAEALGRVAGGIAHEFNNLLTSINASLELVKLRTSGDDRLTRAVDRAGSALRRGAGLSQRMLAYGRQQFLRPVDLDLNRFLREQVANLVPVMRESIVIAPLSLARQTLCRTDPEALEAALLSLAENARDAMPRGGRLTIRTEAVRRVPTEGDMGSGARDYVMLEIRDTGEGISPEILERVCDPFFTTKDVGEGTGLGLSMVQGFVHQSGGELEIESTPGEGTTVRLFLPCPEGRDPMSPADGDGGKLPSCE